MFRVYGFGVLGFRGLGSRLGFVSLRKSGLASWFGFLECI